MQKRFDTALAELLRQNRISASDGGPVLVLAVSGGVDSMSLATLCRHSSVPMKLILAHCNFHLRGEESDADEALVREWGQNNGVEVRVKDFDTVSYSQKHGVSIEMAARELRYGWFGSLCEETGAAATVVAHNANDNAETLILNLLRGTGVRGLGGMRAFAAMPCRCASESDGSVSDSCATRDGALLLRPMLGFTRKQIEGFARANGVKWREDSTNSESEYKRNKIRNEVFPLLETINPSFVKTLNREMRYFSDAARILDGYFENFKSRFVNDGTGAGDRTGNGRESGTRDAAGRIRLGIGDLMAQDSWPYLLYMWLEQYGFNSAAVSSVEHLLRSSAASSADASEAGGRTTLSGKTFSSETHVLTTTSSELIISPADGGDIISPDIKEGTVVCGPGCYTVGGRNVSVEVCDRAEITSLVPPAGTLYLDAGTLAFPFAIRGWHRGDWIRPFGMGGQKKKVSDLFTDLKYDSFGKSSALFIVRDSSDSHVLALLGERIDDSVKITPSTSQILVLSID